MKEVLCLNLQNAFPVWYNPDYKNYESGVFIYDEERNDY